MESTTLKESLSQFQAEFVQTLPESVQVTMSKATQDLIESGIVNRILLPGEKIPTIALPNATGNIVNVNQQLASGPLVLSFYRGGWCPYCNLELKALQAKLPEIQALGAQLIAISPETLDNSLSTTEKNALEFEVLSDRGNQIARTFGLVFTLPETLRPLYTSFGIDLAAYNGDETFELPLPAIYIVATDGTVKLAFADPDYTKRLEPAEIIQTLKELAA